MFPGLPYQTEETVLASATIAAAAYETAEGLVYCISTRPTTNNTQRNTKERQQLRLLHNRRGTYEFAWQARISEFHLYPCNH